MIKDLLRASELDPPSMLELAERVSTYEPDDAPTRSYPGYPAVPLPRVKVRRWTSLDRTLLERRSVRELSGELPREHDLAHLLKFAHGITGERGAGPVPTAGGLAALELYLAVLSDGWLPAGAYHYDRERHRLARVAEPAARERWLELVPSLRDVPSAPMVLVIAGDVARVEKKYGERGHRFLLLEAGHLMQNLALLATSLGLSLVSCGGALEGALARQLVLPRTDAVLYAAACGRV